MTVYQVSPPHADIICGRGMGPSHKLLQPLRNQSQKNRKRDHSTNDANVLLAELGVGANERCISYI